jgi:PAS domain S-box-containing protein
MAEDIRRFADLLRERLPALLERIAADAEEQLFSEEVPVAARELWKRICAGTLERIAECLESGETSDKESLREFVGLMGEHGIGLREALDMKRVISNALASDLAEAGEASAAEAVDLCDAIDRTISVGIDAFLDYTEDLFRSEHKDLLDSIGKVGVIVFRAAPDSTLIQLNDTGISLLRGASDSEVLGRKFAEFYADASEREALRSELLEKGQVVGFRFRGRRLDGTEFWAETNVKVKPDAEGRPEYLEGFARDVTEERARELETNRNTELLSGILGSAVEYGVVATDGAGVINYFSESAELLFGKRSKEVVGTLHIKDLWLPEKRRRLVEDLEQIARTGRYEEETELLRTQGLTFNARVSGSARRDGAGEVTGFTFVIRDVTEERAAQKLVTMLAHALESSREGVTLTDMSGVITYVNPMMTAMTGRGAEEMLGRDFSIFYPEDFAGDEVRAIARATLAGGWSGEVENINRDGVRFPVHLTTSLVRDERGRAVAMVGLTRDVTREKSLQKRLFEQEQRHLAELERQVRERTAELERAYRDLQKLDAMKDRFLTNISHELRTPLVSGVGYIELILQEGLGPINGEIRNGLRVAHRNLLRLVNLIDDLLAFTRLESGGDAMVISRFSLEQMVTDCLLDLKVRANKADLQVQMEVEKGLPAIEADEENVHRVFTNLLSNAEKFTGEQARIRVKARILSAERVEVRVEDDGMGIPEEEIAHIFERFYRSGRTQSTRYSGTGIGLSLVKEILSSHKCDIRAESPEGKGTTIVFTLPLARKGAKAPAASSADGGSGERRPATILVIDDDPEVHDLLEAVFASPGDRLLVASGGQEGLGMAAREELDLVFLDISMDDMDGIEVLKQLRAGEKTRHLPIFMLTARADDRSVVESRKAGASGFITKPFSLAEVRGVVEDILAGSYPDGTD